MRRNINASKANDMLLRVNRKQWGLWKDKFWIALKNDLIFDCFLHLVKIDSKK